MWRCVKISANLERRPGWWGTHEYKRHSVEEVKEFCGWGTLERICKAAGTPRDRAFPATLFLTGCRVSEGLRLRKTNFDLADPDFIRVLDCPIVKQRTMGASRTFSFLRREPLVPFLVGYLQTLKREDSLLFPFERLRAYEIVTRLGKAAGLEIWNHWFRSQRASCLGGEYGLSESELLEWFACKDRTWVRRYCKKGDFGLRKALTAKAPVEFRV